MAWPTMKVVFDFTLFNADIDPEVLAEALFDALANMHIEPGGWSVDGWELEGLTP